ncbi:hypothetical protein ACWF9G_24815 [Nocardia sp. NPDC055029]
MREPETGHGIVACASRDAGRIGAAIGLFGLSQWRSGFHGRLLLSKCLVGLTPMRMTGVEFMVAYAAPDVG